jgi:hypothetical protein
MARIRPKVEDVNRKLRRAMASLNAAAGDIRDANLYPKRNIRRVGEALMSIFAILDDVYHARPDLLPKYLFDTKFGRRVLSNKRLERADHPRGGRARRRVGRSTASR